MERRANGTGGMYAALALPAVHDDEVLAVVVLYSSEPFTLGERLMDALTDAGLQLGAFLGRRRGILRPQTLTSRELEVLSLVLKGFGTPQIATALDIAESTAHDHIKRMMLKTRARNRVELAAKALGWRGA